LQNNTQLAYPVSVICVLTCKFGDLDDSVVQVWGTRVGDSSDTAIQI
jgi:hypothetical protein